EIPGTTRDAVRQTIQVEGVPMNIIDTAGLRDTSDTVERFGIARAWDAIERADVLLLVVDARTGVTPEDERIRDRLPRNLARIVVFNKIDLCGVAAASEDAEDARRIRLSAKTGEGVDLLRAAMVSIAGWQATNEDIFMARERHVVCLERALQGLGRALDAITGETTPDDVLGEIFSRFCIGK